MTQRIPSHRVRHAIELVVAALSFSIAAAAYAPDSSQIYRPRNIPYSEVQPLFDELRADLLPPELRDRKPPGRRSGWPAWVAQHDTEIRGRLLRGYEDSIVNLVFFGTRFTGQPRIRSADIPSLAGDRSEQLERRLDDLAAAVVDPGTNGRLRFVRTMVDSRGINPATPSGKRAARDYFSALVARFVSDRDRYNRAYWTAKQLDDPSATLFAQSTIYRDRGLSSDTSIFADYALDAALRDLRNQGLLGRPAVHRVGVIGPGLDFTDKDEGYDFYPQQTIQPFALIDSLQRLDMAAPGDFRMTAFDLNPSVIEHLQAARLRAAAGEPYVIQLARNIEGQWLDPLASYWRRVGSAVGQDTTSTEPPPAAAAVEVRAVRIPPAVVLSLTPQNLNIVLQRVEPPRGDQFDLIVATNILVYYGVFEQALALVNVARMLRPGGIFLTNNVVLSSPTMMMVGYSDVPYTEAGDGDRIWWYQRQ